MKFKTFLLNSVIVLVISILGFGVGKLVGNFSIGESDPSWKYYTLPPSPKRIIDIVFFQPSPTSDYLPGDSLYVRTENGEFYSYTLFQDKWMFVDADTSRWENPYVTKCATEWAGPSDFYQLKDYPPVTRDVVDSMGENFWNYPSTSIAKCYILFDDGSVQAWIYSGNAKVLLTHRLWKNIIMSIGILTGVTLGLLVIHKRVGQIELSNA